MGARRAVAQYLTGGCLHTSFPVLTPLDRIEASGAYETRNKIGYLGTFAALG